MPSRARRTARSPPGPRSSETDSPEAISIVTPPSPGEPISSGRSSSATSPRRARQWPVSRSPRCPSASGRQPSREASQPQNSTPAAVESRRWRTVTFSIASRQPRIGGGSNVAATRSRHGVERSQARSTT